MFGTGSRDSPIIIHSQQSRAALCDSTDENEMEWADAFESRLCDDWDRLENSLCQSSGSPTDDGRALEALLERQLSDAWVHLEASLHDAVALTRASTTSSQSGACHVSIPAPSSKFAPTVRNALGLTGGHTLGREVRPPRRSYHAPSHGQLCRRERSDNTTPATTREFCPDIRQKARVEPEHAPSSSDDHPGRSDQLALRPKPEPPGFAQNKAPSARHETTQPSYPSLTHRVRLPASLDYQIPHDLLRAARGAPAGTPRACWSHKLYRSSLDKPITVYLCTKKAHVPKVLQRFANATVLGFDLEWEMFAKLDSARPKRLVSVAQLAMEDAIAVIQLATFHEDEADDLLPAELRAILENPAVLKVGVNIANDFRRLNKVFGVQGRGICELSRLYRVVQYSNCDPAKVNNSLVKLASQVEDILALPLYKGSVRCSAWSQRLTKEQSDYAATDAYAGFRLYHALESQRNSMQPIPAHPLPFSYPP